MEIKREQITILGIDSEADVGVCRRKAVGLSRQIGFDEVKTGEVAILVSELVTNVLKHAGGSGRILMCCFRDNHNRLALEIWCCDNGNGIPDPEKALTDGYTGKQSLGIGLGTIRRFSDLFELQPIKDEGINNLYCNLHTEYTHCLRIVKWVPEKIWKGNNRSISWGATSCCKPGETLNGDGYVVNHLTPTRTVAAVIDGLGHGKEANIATSIIKEQILLKSDLPPFDLIKYLHQAARGTRGAVIALMMINTELDKLSFIGIGNIEGFIISESGKKTLISFGGILGHNIRSPHIHEFPFSKGDTVCLYSDGIHSRWNTNDINWKENPQKISEYLITNYSRLNDDATVLVISHTA